ncbi:MAG TPA: response regulator [Aurantimonas sp.]|nr:response regulator [Aurantimonas sp.]
MPLAEIHTATSGQGSGSDDEQASVLRTSLEYPFGQRILIVEDNWLIAIEWQAALEAAGYEVFGPAVSAEEAMAVSEDELPDFVLMDIRLLGGSDGVDAAIRIRSHLQIPAIFVSAHDEPETRERALAAKPLGWITKPVVATRLPEMIRQMKMAKT